MSETVCAHVKVIAYGENLAAVTGIFIVDATMDDYVGASRSDLRGH